jgi:hypothetical protein
MAATSSAVAQETPARSRIGVTAVLIEDTGWQEDAVMAGITEALAIFEQCGVAAGSIVLSRVGTEPAMRDLFTPVSRRLAATVNPARPAVFVARTGNDPAFDAEAFGAGNTQTRPELRDTIWISRRTPDLPGAIAHELFHVLANSGEHSGDRSNLMYEATAPGRRQLTAAQCTVMVDTARKNKLLATD